MASVVSQPNGSVNFSGTLTQGVVSAQVNQTPTIQFAASSVAGTFPVGSVNRIASYSGLINSGTPVVYNLTSGLDPLGNALAMLHVLGIVFQNNSVTSGQNITLGAGTHPINSDVYFVQPGGNISIVNPNPGITIVAATNDQITLTCASGTNVPYILTVYGRST